LSEFDGKAPVTHWKSSENFLMIGGTAESLMPAPGNGENFFYRLNIDFYDVGFTFFV
jgi:hypothetical protein